MGLLREKVVIRKLLKNGWRILEYNPSYGKTDIMARNGRRIWLIQVKTTTEGDFRQLSSNELKGLKSRAKKKNAIPVVAYVYLTGTRTRIRFFSIISGRELKP